MVDVAVEERGGEGRVPAHLAENRLQVRTGVRPGGRGRVLVTAELLPHGPHVVVQGDGVALAEQQVQSQPEHLAP